LGGFFSQFKNVCFVFRRIYSLFLADSKIVKLAVAFLFLLFNTQKSPYAVRAFFIIGRKLILIKI